MRKNKLIVAVALLAASTAAKAQFTNTTATAAKATQTQVQGWGSVYVQWNPVTIAVDKKGEDDISANAFTIGYNKAFSIAKGTPLFVEAGIGLSYMFKTNEEPYEDLDEVGDYDWQVSGDKYSMLSAKVPVSLAYCWSLPNSSVDLIPFVGVDFRINLVGKLKKQFELGSEFDGDEKEEYEDLYEMPADQNLFDKDDMGDKDLTWKRFQMGWHVGLNARFNKGLMIGVAYGTDFTELCKKTKMKTTSITLGYSF